MQLRKNIHTIGALALTLLLVACGADRNLKKAEKYLSYRLSDEEIESFWKEEKDEELVYRLYDYIQSSSSLTPEVSTMIPLSMH